MGTILPKPWLDELRKLQRTFPEAVVAGGALRDTLLGRPVADVDIFVDGDCGHSSLLLDGWEQEFLFDGVEYKEGTQGRNIVAIYGKTIGGMKYQVVALAGREITPESVVEDMGIGLCKIATDGRSDFRHPDFLRDAENHVLTVVNASAPDATRRRIERWRPKYDWPVVWQDGEPADDEELLFEEA